MYEAKVIADSVSSAGVRLTTLQLRYWRAIHAEFMTHRAFSRNASSSRAIPVAKMIKQVRNDPAGPIHWGINRPGMQAREQLTGSGLENAQELWRCAAWEAAETAERMMAMGLHKQVANRILEPFQYISVIVTATDWTNFFNLRDHADAQPEIQLLAQLMRKAMADSIPLKLNDGEWHLPYVHDSEIREHEIDVCLKLSTARCARVSYLTHDGKAPNVADDIALHDRLVVAEPLHASPSEHQARAMSDGFTYIRNFHGWQQYRDLLETM